MALVTDRAIEGIQTLRLNDDETAELRETLLELDSETNGRGIDVIRRQHLTYLVLRSSQIVLFNVSRIGAHHDGPTQSKRFHPPGADQME
jgi:hypothetical protein